MDLNKSYSVRTYWDSFTTSYQMGAQKHRLYLLDLLKEKGVTSLLDVGCGTGPIFELLRDDLVEKGIDARWGFKYRGVDYSPAMIEIAKESFPGGEFEVDDARHLKQEDDSFDTVLLMHCLDHLDDYESAIREAARVAKRYVCIILWRPISDGDKNNLNSVNRMGRKDDEEPWEDTHLQEYSRSNLEKAFEKAGLKIVKTAEGDELNSDQSHYNFLFLLEKI